jgi:hypothetical protein
MNEEYKLAGLTIEEIKKMPEYISGDLDFYDTPAFNKLYEYFSDSGEMPYEVVKARTETPDEWILNKAENETC